MMLNQNHIKRILENRRYIGEQGYPAIIRTTEFDMVIAQKADNSRRHQQKRGTTELSLGYRLLPYEPTARALRLTHDINRALERSPDPEQVKPMILACAAEKYNAIGVIYNG